MDLRYGVGAEVAHKMASKQQMDENEKNISYQLSYQQTQFREKDSRRLMLQDPMNVGYEEKTFYF